MTVEMQSDLFSLSSIPQEVDKCSPWIHEHLFDAAAAE